jgi:hypothetical protein
MATELSKIWDLNTDDTICSIYGRYPGALTCALPSPSPKIHGHVVCELLHSVAAPSMSEFLIVSRSILGLYFGKL